MLEATWSWTIWGSPINLSHPKHSKYAICAYIDPQTTPTDRHIWQSHGVSGHAFEDSLTVTRFQHLVHKQTELIEPKPAPRLPGVPWLAPFGDLVTSPAPSAAVPRTSSSWSAVSSSSQGPSLGPLAVSSKERIRFSWSAVSFESLSGLSGLERPHHESTLRKRQAAVRASRVYERVGPWNAPNKHSKANQECEEPADFPFKIYIDPKRSMP